MDDALPVDQPHRAVGRHGDVLRADVGAVIPGVAAGVPSRARPPELFSRFSRSQTSPLAPAATSRAVVSHLCVSTPLL